MNIVWQDCHGIVGPPNVPLPVVQSIDQAHCFATWDRVLIQMWQGVATLAAADDLLRVARLFLTNSDGGPLSCLSIVGSQSHAPSDKVRERLGQC